MGGNFAWLYATYQAERTGTPLDSFWNRLPPPLLREGNKVQTPWLTAFLKDPHMIRPAAQSANAAVPFWQGRASLARETDSWPTTSPRGIGPSFPYQTIPEQNPSYLAEREQGPSQLSGGRLGDDDEQGFALPAVSRDRPVQAERRSAGRQRAGPAGGRDAVPAGVPGGLDRQSAPARCRSRRCRRISHRMGTVQIPVPKTFENKPIDMVERFATRLLNYVNAVEHQLASTAPAGAAPVPAGAPPQAPGSAR